MATFFEKVYEAVKLVPCGKVTTYGDLARAVGAPKMSRYVGCALHRNPQPGIIPCHRVVFADGRLSYGFAFGGIEIQKSILQSEGVEVSDDYKVDMQKYRYAFGD